MICGEALSVKLCVPPLLKGEALREKYDLSGESGVPKSSRPARFERKPCETDEKWCRMNELNFFALRVLCHFFF